MATWLRISESAALAFHTVGVLARAPETMITNHEIAAQLHVSEHHLAKVHQRLVKAGVLHAVRGPTGGFRLERPAAEITLREVAEAVDGANDADQCLLGRPHCAAPGCVVGCFSASINRQVQEFLAGTTVADLAGRAPALIDPGVLRERDGRSAHFSD